MRIHAILLIVLAGVFTLSACRKDKDSRCQDLSVGITSGDKEAVKKEINAIINTLPLSSRKHTNENLVKLVSAINRQCQITASKLCYGCIKTLPEQSEIRISTTGVGATVHKTIDITADKDGNMIFGNMHE